MFDCLILILFLTETCNHCSSGNWPRPGGGISEGPPRVARAVRHGARRRRDARKVDLEKVRPQIEFAIISTEECGGLIQLMFIH